VRGKESRGVGGGGGGGRAPGLVWPTLELLACGLPCLAQGEEAEREVRGSQSQACWRETAPGALGRPWGSSVKFQGCAFMKRQDDFPPLGEGGGRKSEGRQGPAGRS
jgi:hypothetical protein